jgi:hypothetical protein
LENHVTSSSIKISPGFDAYYHSFYLLGLKRSEETASFPIRFIDPGFPLHATVWFAFQHLDKRIVIDARDGADIHPQALEWCDILGKVNYSSPEIPAKFRNKVIPIGPSFGVRIWPLAYAGILGFINFCHSKMHLKFFRKYMVNYYWQYKYRLPESQYTYTPAEENHIFFVTSLWKQAQTTNENRMRFIKNCQSQKDILFEGGFSPQTLTSARGYEEYTAVKRYAISEYITKTKRSLVVFNTPAVLDCFGWKLGEYLALGKAIISTPLTRELPAKLVHGKHIHFTDGSETSIRAAIDLICRDKAYRTTLETNARSYYEQYLQPARVISRLLNSA